MLTGCWKDIIRIETLHFQGLSSVIIVLNVV